MLALMAAGQSNQEIADRLFMTRKTASIHVISIKDKLGVANRVEAATLRCAGRSCLPTAKK